MKKILKSNEVSFQGLILRKEITKNEKTVIFIKSNNVTRYELI